MRGEKRVEYRTRATKIVGERFYIYAAGRWPVGVKQRQVWSRDLRLPEAEALPWLAELATGLKLFPATLPTGVLVGSAVIAAVQQRGDGMFGWQLSQVERLAKPLRPNGHPQPTWWFPFAA